MLTGSGQRDLSPIYQIYLYMDQEYKIDVISMIDCLNDTLWFDEPFPLLKMDKGIYLQKETHFACMRI